MTAERVTQMERVATVPIALVGKSLLELSESWLISLDTSPITDGWWFLTLTPRLPGRGHRTHSYHGGDLARVISAAWAGAPDGEVK